MGGRPETEARDPVPRGLSFPTCAGASGTSGAVRTRPFHAALHTRLPALAQGQLSGEEGTSWAQETPGAWGAYCRTPAAAVQGGAPGPSARGCLCLGPPCSRLLPARLPPFPGNCRGSFSFSLALTGAPGTWPASLEVLFLGCPSPCSPCRGLSALPLRGPSVSRPRSPLPLPLPSPLQLSCLWNSLCTRSLPPP